MHYLILDQRLMIMNVKKIDVIYIGNNPVVLEDLIEYSKTKAIFCIPDNNENIIKILEIAKKHSIPVKQPNRKELLSYIPYIINLKPDLIVVCGYKYIIPKEIFNIAKFRTINIHPSYLPAYRGQHVINWAIINGEKETGVTIHYIDEGIDTGDIILQKKIEILFDDTAQTLHDKIYLIACELLHNVINNITCGKEIIGKKQNDANATYFKPRTPEDGRIDWNMDGLEIYNLIRGLAKPWPGAHSYIDGNKIIIWQARIEKCNSSNYSNGEIIDMSNSTIIIKVKDGKLCINDYMFLDTNGDIINPKIEIGKKFG
jgi:methionyl-tRNA formyltransferase